MEDQMGYNGERHERGRRWLRREEVWDRGMLRPAQSKLVENLSGECATGELKGRRVELLRGEDDCE